MKRLLSTPHTMPLNKDKAAELAMAMLSLTMFRNQSGVHAWKGIDWDVMDDLFERNWIHNPAGKRKSATLTEGSEREALLFQEKYLHQSDEE